MILQNTRDIDFVKLNKKIDLVIPAQTAKLGPPVGPVLGQVKMKVKDFCTSFNEYTMSYKLGFPLKVVVFVYKNETFDFIVYPPSVAFLIKNNLNTSKKKTLSYLDIYKIMLIKRVEFKNVDDKIIFRNILSIAKSMKVQIT